MRVLVVALFIGLATVAHSAVPVATGSAEAVSAAPESQTFFLFGKKKKKKIKTSNRMKKSNKKMAKKFRRQNDDTLRR